MFEALDRLGRQIIGLLLEHPWLVGPFLIGFLYFVVRPILNHFLGASESKDAAKLDALNTSVLTQDKYDLDAFTARSYQYAIARKPSLIAPDRLQRFPHFADEQAYIEYHRKMRFFVAYFAACEFRHADFDSDELEIDYGVDSYLLTNKRLTYFDPKDFSSAKHCFELSEIVDYERTDRSFGRSGAIICTADGNVHKFNQSSPGKRKFAEVKSSKGVAKKGQSA